jgi:probable phosphoglycerate mutase
MDAVLTLVAGHPGETIVAVSHADPIKAIVAAAAGVPLDLMQRLVISPCSVSALLFTSGGPVVLCVNSTGSLSELAPS